MTVHESLRPQFQDGKWTTLSLRDTGTVPGSLQSHRESFSKMYVRCHFLLPRVPTHQVPCCSLQAVMVTLLCPAPSPPNLAYPWHSNHGQGPLLVTEEGHCPQEGRHLDRQGDFLPTNKWRWLTWPSGVTDSQGRRIPENVITMHCAQGPHRRCAREQ